MEHDEDVKKLQSIGIEVKEELLTSSTGVFPTILIAVLSGITAGFLSAVGKDIWTTLKEYLIKRFQKLDEGRGGSCRIYGVYVISEIDEVPVVYYSIPKKGHLELNFNWSDLEDSDTELQYLIKSKKLHKKEFLGVNLDRLGSGSYYRFFKNVPDEDIIIDEMTTEDLEKQESWDHELVGLYFDELGMLEKARKHYKLAIKRFPERKGLYINLGATYAKEGDLSNCLVYWEKAAAIDGKYETLYYNLACVYALQGDVESAIHNLKLAADKGYRDVEHLLKDPDLASIRNDPRINAIITDIKKRR